MSGKTLYPYNLLISSEVLKELSASLKNFLKDTQCARNLLIRTAEVPETYMNEETGLPMYVKKDLLKTFQPSDQPSPGNKSPTR